MKYIVVILLVLNNSIIYSTHKHASMDQHSIKPPLHKNICETSRNNLFEDIILPNINKKTKHFSDNVSKPNKLHCVMSTRKIDKENNESKKKLLKKGKYTLREHENHQSNTMEKTNGRISIKNNVFNHPEKIDDTFISFEKRNKNKIIQKRCINSVNSVDNQKYKHVDVDYRLPVVNDSTALVSNNTNTCLTRDGIICQNYYHKAGHVCSTVIGRSIPISSSNPEANLCLRRNFPFRKVFKNKDKLVEICTVKFGEKRNR